MRRLLKRMLTPPLLLVAAVVILAEEVLWRLEAVYGLIGRMPLVRRVEAGIVRLPPYGALVLFALPSVCLFPVKLLALYWLAGGHPALGISTIAGAKVAGTAFVAHLYRLTRPALVTIPWLAWLERKVLALRAAAYGLLRDSAAWRWAALRVRAWRERFRAARASWFSLRWASAKWKARRAISEPREMR